jgi:sulfide:quinone oxidoreductase
VPFFARELVKIAARYGIEVHYQHNLVAVDGPLKMATFEKVGEQNKGERITVPFDMLHVSPPQSPPDEIKSSPLVNAAGWVEVDQNSMQHVRHPNYSPSVTSVRRQIRRRRRLCASRRRLSSTTFCT